MGIRKVALLLSLVFVLIVSACGNNQNEGANPNKNSGSNTTATHTEQAENTEPFGKYESPVEVRVAVPSDANWKYPEGDSFENNAWIRGFEEELGIKVVYEWTTNEESYFNKMNMSISSADLPDVFVVNGAQLRRLAEAGQLEDLTGAYDNYAAPFTKELIEGDGGLGLKAASFDGKLVGLPQSGSTIYELPMIWLRTDWMEKLQLQDPKSMDDLIEIAHQFKNNDPDGNGKPDTYGFPITKELYGGIASLTGFFNGFHAYPQLWLQDDADQVVYGSIQPEMKTALLKLQALYSAGLIDPEFGVKDGTKVVDDITVGKFGINFGNNWNPINFIDLKTKDPDSDWKAIPLVSIDDEAALGSIGFPATRYTVVRKGFKHPEVAVKLLNFYQEKRYGETKDESVYNPDDAKGNQTHVYTSAPVRSDKANKMTIFDLKNLAEAVTKKDPSLLTDYIPEYDKIVKYEDGDVSGWASTRQGGPENSGFSILIHAYETDAYVATKFGGQTETMAAKWSTLEKLEKETFTKIILGYSDISAFDEFVEKWHALGGQEITNEINRDVASQ